MTPLAEDASGGQGSRMELRESKCANCPDYREHTPPLLGACLNPEGPTGKVFSKSIWATETGYPAGCPRDPDPPAPPRRRPGKKGRKRRLRQLEQDPTFEPMGKQGDSW